MQSLTRDLAGFGSKVDAGLGVRWPYVHTGVRSDTTRILSLELV